MWVAWLRGKKKKFPDVVGMVQHSRKIIKTKKISEHRGYARAMCYLLGWDAQAPNGPAVRGCIPAIDDGKSTKQVPLPHILPFNCFMKRSQLGLFESGISA